MYLHDTAFIGHVIIVASPQKIEIVVVKWCASTSEACRRFESR